MSDKPERLWTIPYEGCTLLEDVADEHGDRAVMYIRADLVSALNDVAALAFEVIDGAVEDHEVTPETIYADDWTGLRDELEKAGVAVDNALRGNRE